MAKARKLELPAQLDVVYTPPEDALVGELSAMIEQARADANALLADDAKGPAAERYTKAEWLITAIDAIEARQDELVAADTAQKAQLDALRERLAPKASDAEETEEERAAREAKAKAEEDAAEDTPPVIVESGTATDPAVPAGVMAPALVASTRSVIADVAGSGTAPSVADKRRATRKSAYITAAAGVAGFEAGATVDWDGVGRIAASRFKSLPSGPHGSFSQQPIANIVTPTTDTRLVASLGEGEFADARDAVEWAVNPERLKQETGEASLTAAGWCAPSETLYDLINLTTTDGLLDIPGITVNRGGVRFSLGPDFATVYNVGANFSQTEAQNIAGTVKPVVNIPCPTFTDNRMGVSGLYLTGDILSQKGYPEGYADYTQKALTAFAHYINAQTIIDMVAAATAVDLVTTQKDTLSISTELLGAIEIQVMDMRYKNRLSLTSLVEVVLPLWLKGALRSDFAKRLGVENTQNITDATMATYFNARGANLQWVYDWQDAFTGVAAGFGAATPILTWPVSAKFLIYPQGAFVRALSDLIELNAVYDSVLLKTNQFVALFLEQGRLTLKRTWDARVCTVPVTVSGATALGIDYTVVARQPTV